ncbi:unnamed protein product [Nezara viridula]|uniref:C2H2-type domain-containing protein n=1 Tax=Nezara viridula TaxID=85310 RepID=A0A9P0EA05_NEZVI|nr:unnamed protein product [Nezara viridula]
MVEMEESYEGCLDFVLSPQIEPSDKMYPGTPVENFNKSESRRGRPKAAMISNLILEGSISKNGIRCDICSRVFPRDKSLQAHRRVHTGERPYSCDYPGCTRKFKQSGQLKTHQRLHTGERPFLCSAEGCNSRFTHANRHCTSHPNATLIRCDDFALLDSSESNQSEEVKQWLLKYRAERREARSSDKKRNDSPRRDMTPTLSDMTNVDRENRTPGQTSRKSLFGTPDSPRKRELPKKRWLRIASREQESLANLNRPTVLRHAGCLSPPPSGNNTFQWLSSPTWATSTPIRNCGPPTPPHSAERHIKIEEEVQEILAVPLPNDSFNSSFEIHHHIESFNDQVFNIEYAA